MTTAVARSLLAIGISVVVIVALTFPIQLPAQSPIVIRPTQPTQDTPGGFTNVNKAFDANPLTAAATNASTHCHLMCLIPAVKTTIWSGFPAGYVPTKLVVRWGANGLFNGMWSGTSGSIDASVFYSLNGGSS